jgi:hypothetical protein
LRTQTPSIQNLSKKEGKFYSKFRASIKVAKDTKEKDKKKEKEKEKEKEKATGGKSTI